jgi:hypothetical protein
MKPKICDADVCPSHQLVHSLPGGEIFILNEVHEKRGRCHQIEKNLSLYGHVKRRAHHYFGRDLFHRSVYFTIAFVVGKHIGVMLHLTLIESQATRRQLGYNRSVKLLSERVAKQQQRPAPQLLH